MTTATAPDRVPLPVATAQGEDLRRITEDDPDYQKLHTTTVARLTRSLAQYIREERKGVQGADSRFINRHIALMRQAYEAAHHEGQKDYWPAVSNRTVQHRYVKPADEQTQKRLTYYALGSVMKLAHQVKSYVAQQKTLSEQQLSYTFDDLPGDYGSRVMLQGSITWSGLQDGYNDAGASDGANPYSLIYWNLGPVKTEHCDDCPGLAMGSPYDPPWAGAGSNQLNQTPGDGQTECGAACKCSLSYSAPAEGSPELAELNAAKAQQWQDFMGGVADGSPLPAITVGGVPGAQRKVFTPLQKQYMDTHRNLQEQWNAARGTLPEAPDMFRRPEIPASAPRTPWGALTPYQQSILDQMTQNEIDWLHAVGQLNWPEPPYEPDLETRLQFWLKDAAAGRFTPWWDAMVQMQAADQETQLQQWLDEVAHSNRWDDPPQIDQRTAMEQWLEKVAKSVEWPPDSSQLSENPEWLPTIELINNYPRQSGGRFGFGPGKVAGSGGGSGKGAKGTGGTAKTTRTAKASANASTPKPMTRKEQKAAAEQRLADAQKKANKAQRDFTKAEKAAALKQINNKDEIAKLQAEHHVAYINQYHSYSDAKEAIAEERARAKGESGKAPKTYERMQAAKQPYEEAKANLEAADATAAASKAASDELDNKYFDFNKYGYDYTKLQRDHPDLKAADKQRWADERAATKAQHAFYKAERAYQTPRDQLAGEITDTEINAHPIRVAANAALADVSARLGEANGQTALRAAFDTREGARNELKDAQTAMAHPTWKYDLYSAPTTHALYQTLDAWPRGALDDARASDPGGNLDRHVGDVALSELEHAQGFDGKADIVSESDLNAYVKNGEVELWRGDSKVSHTDDMMMGDYHAGLGIRGNGTYAQEGAEGIATARSYASNRGQSATPGTIMRMSVKSDARVIDYSDLQDESNRAWSKAKADEQAARARGDVSAARRFATQAWVASSDTSRYAVAMGYDAVHVTHGSGKGQWIILNRTAVRISHQIRGGNT